MAIEFDKIEKEIKHILKDYVGKPFTLQDLEDAKNIILNGNMNMRQRLEETKEEKYARAYFELSHPFKIGDKVICLNEGAASSVYKGMEGVVTRVKTDQDTGSCIRAEFGGVGLNFWKPNEELIYATDLAKLLYS